MGKSSFFIYQGNTGLTRAVWATAGQDLLPRAKRVQELEKARAAISPQPSLDIDNQNRMLLYKIQTSRLVKAIDTKARFDRY